uniref:Dynein heavy chain hydrolytic ATP-binding dynein motor region domain-containing protein n=1 Tax=Acrobeloides nanus TaxID=290746 RepID=A0A914C3S1_9BILA
MAILNEIIGSPEKSHSLNDIDQIKQALKNVITSSLVANDVRIFNDLVLMDRNHDLKASAMTQDDHKIRNMLTQICNRLKLHSSQPFITKCLELYRILRTTSHVIVLLGRPLVGKSTSISVVKELIKQVESSNIDVLRIYPSQFDQRHLNGYYDNDNLQWANGVFTQPLIDFNVRGKTRRSSINYKKIVLDMLGSKTERLTVIYGNAGSGKSQFVRQFFNELDHEKWEAHILDISTKMDANQLLQSILDCNLTNANKNARANPSGKSTLILLNNFSNLRSREWNCPFEMLRSLLDSKTIRNIDGEEIVLPSVGDQNPKLIWRAYMNLSSDKIIKQALFNEANCAIRGIEGDLAKLCTKHLDEISILFKTMKFSSANKNVFAFMLEDVDSVEIVTSADVEFKIKELVKKLVISALHKALKLGATTQ